MKSQIIRFILSTFLFISVAETGAGQALQKVNEYPFKNHHDFVEDHDEQKAYFFLERSDWSAPNGDEFMIETSHKSEGSLIFKIGQDSIITNDLDDIKSRLIRTAVPFNENGWIVAGDFTSWTNADLNYIAGLDTLGNAVDLGIQLNGPVSKMWLIQDTLYFTGSFSSVNGQPRRGFAVVNTVDFSLLEKYLFLTNSVENIADLNDRIAISRARPTSPNTYTEGLQYDKYTGDQLEGDLILPKDEINWYPLSNLIGNDRGILNISKAISDENGGFFVVGKFSQYGDSTRENVVHINSNGKVSEWRCDVFPGPVYDIELQNDTLYFSGTINKVRGQNRYGYAAVDLVTNSLTSLTYTDTPSFEMTDENMSESLDIWDIEVSQSKIFLRGIMNNNYTTHNVYSINDSLELDLIKSHNYEFDNNVYSNGATHISLPTEDGGWLYVDDNGLSRLNSLGEELNFTIPVVDWGTSEGDRSTDMDRNGERVFLCNNLSTHEYNELVDLNNIISINSETGEVYPFFIDYNYTSTNDINDVTCYGDTVFIACDNSSNQDWEPVNFSAYNGVTSENFEISVAPEGDVYGVEIVNDVIYVFGDFTELSNGVPARNVVKYDRLTLELLDFDLDFPHEVTSMASDGEYMYFVAEGWQEYLGAFSLENETMIDWSPPMNRIEHLEVFGNHVLVTGRHILEDDADFVGVVAYQSDSNLPKKKLFEAVSEFFENSAFSISGDWLYPRYSIQNNRVFVAFGMAELDKRSKERLQCVDKNGNHINNPPELFPDAVDYHFESRPLKSIGDGYLVSAGGFAEDGIILRISNQLNLDTLEIETFTAFDDLTIINDTIYSVVRTAFDEARVAALNPELTEVIWERTFDLSTNSTAARLQIDADDQNVYISGHTNFEEVFDDGIEIRKAAVVGFNRFSGDSLTHLPDFYINEFLSARSIYSNSLGIAVSDSNLFMQGPKVDIGEDLQIIEKSTEEILAEYEQDVKNMISYDSDLILLTRSQSSGQNTLDLLKLNPTNQDTAWSFQISLTNPGDKPYKLLISGDSLIMTGYFLKGYDSLQFVNSVNLNSGEIGITQLDGTIAHHPAGADLFGEHLLIECEIEELSPREYFKSWNLSNQEPSSFDPILISRIAPDGIITSGSHILILSAYNSYVRVLNEGPNFFEFDVASNSWSSQENSGLYDVYGPSRLYNRFGIIKSVGTDSLYAYNRSTGTITSVNKFTWEVGDSIQTNLIDYPTDLISGYATQDFLYLFGRQNIEVFGETREKFVQIDLDNYSLTDFAPDFNQNYLVGIRGSIDVVNDSIIFQRGYGQTTYKINIATNEVSNLLPGYNSFQYDFELGDSILVSSRMYSADPGPDVDPLIKPLYFENYWTNEEVVFENLDILSDDFFLNDSLLLVRHSFFQVYNPFPTPYSLFDVKNRELLVDAEVDPLSKSAIGGFIGKTVFANSIYEFVLCSSSVTCQDTTIFMSLEESILLPAAELVSDFTTECAEFSPPTFELSKDFFDCSDVGTSEVALSMTLNGQSATCQSIVTVLDTISPALSCIDTMDSEITIICPEDLVTNVQNECLAVDFSINGEEEFELTCDDWNEMIEVEITAIDASGNSSTCTSEINVNLLSEDTDEDGIEDICDLCIGDNSSGDTDGDGICNDSEVAGCQDPAANNYNPDATDPAPCSYGILQLGGVSTIMLPDGSPLSGRPAPDFSIYPNPLKDGDLTILFSSPPKSGAQVVVYDLLGKVVFQDKVNEEQSVLVIPATHFMAEGVYLISFKSEEGVLSHRKVMVLK